MDSVNNMHASNTKIKIVKRRSDKKTVLNSALVFVCFEIFWDMCKNAVVGGDCRVQQSC